MTSYANSTPLSPIGRDAPADHGRVPSSPTDPDLDTNLLIRQIVVAQSPEEATRSSPEGTTAASESAVRHPRRLFKAIPASDKAVDGHGPVTEAQAPSPSATGDLLARIRAYRPTRKHVFFAVVALIVLWRPWLLPITLFTSFWVVLIAYFTLGPDRVAELVVNSWQRLRIWHPGLAEKLRQRAEHMAERVDAFLDRVPGKWTENVHVPDFSPPEDDAADRPDPFERLKKAP